MLFNDPALRRPDWPSTNALMSVALNAATSARSFTQPARNNPATYRYQPMVASLGAQVLGKLADQAVPSAHRRHHDRCWDQVQLAQVTQQRNHPARCQPPHLTAGPPVREKQADPDRIKISRSELVVGQPPAHVRQQMQVRDRRPRRITLPGQLQPIATRVRLQRPSHEHPRRLPHDRLLRPSPRSRRGKPPTTAELCRACWTVSPYPAGNPAPGPRVLGIIAGSA